MRNWRGRSAGRCSRAACLFLASFLAATLAAPRVRADATQDRRVESGLRIFRALLAADVDLDKKVLPDGKLLVLFLYTDDKKRAEELASSAEPVRGLPVLVETTSDVTFRDYGRRVPAAVFLVQSPDAASLHAVIRYGIAGHLIVYSPFEGHVESGVLGGLSVGAQVRPYVNQETLTASGITLKEFFLKVAKVLK